eukprot:scaffold15278_cov37-Attheya_sp.AAC.5
MAVTELTLSTLETGSDSDRLGSGDEQQSSASSKRARSESSYQQRIPMFRLTVTHSQPLNVVATRLDTKQLMEAEIQRATQDAARGQAEGRFVINNGRRYPINKRNGFVSDWPMGHSGRFLRGEDHRFKYCSRRNEQGGKARFHSNFGAHRPEHKRVRRMEERADCVKRVGA